MATRPPPSRRNRHDASHLHRRRPHRHRSRPSRFLRLGAAAACVAALIAAGGYGATQTFGPDAYDAAAPSPRRRATRRSRSCTRAWPGSTARRPRRSSPRRRATAWSRAAREPGRPVRRGAGRHRAVRPRARPVARQPRGPVRRIGRRPRAVRPAAASDQEPPRAGVRRPLSAFPNGAEHGGSVRPRHHGFPSSAPSKCAASAARWRSAAASRARCSPFCCCTRTRR